MTRPQSYEWWIDAIQDCLGQIAQQHEAINESGGACRHVCDETYVDLDHFLGVVTANGFCDVPPDVWQRVVELSQAEDLDSRASRAVASECLAADYFRSRERWKCVRKPPAGRTPGSMRNLLALMLALYGGWTFVTALVAVTTSPREGAQSVPLPWTSLGFGALLLVIAVLLSRSVRSRCETA
ncbi:MAG: hypothetical protein R3F29_08525 [Planctomycetota bacterium]